MATTRPVLLDGRLDPCGSVTSVRVFASLPPTLVHHLEEMAERRTYQASTPVDVHSSGEEACCAVLKGSVRQYLLSPGGRELTLRVIAPGEIFDLPSQEEDDALIAETLDDGTEIASWQWTELGPLIAGDPGASLRFLAVYRERQREDGALLRSLAFSSVRARVAHTLGRLAFGAPNRELRITRAALASLVASREREVNKALERLAGEGLIALPRYGRTITILDIERLATYCASPPSGVNRRVPSGKEDHPHQE